MSELPTQSQTRLIGRPTNKNPSYVPRETIQVLYGSLLGDGSLVTPMEGHNPFFSETHSLKQLDYLIWKNSFFRPLNSKINYQAKRAEIFLYTSVYPFLADVKSELYPNGKKCPTVEFLNKLDELGLAVWIFDDGDFFCKFQAGGKFNGIRKGVRISTCAFTKFENQLIAEWFEKRWGIKPSIDLNGRDKYRLGFYGDDAVKLCKIIRDFLPDGISHKKELCLKIANLKLNKIKKVQKEKLKKKLTRLYWDEKKTQLQIANELGYSQPWVNKWMKRLGIIARPCYLHLKKTR